MNSDVEANFQTMNIQETQIHSYPDAGAENFGSEDLGALVIAKTLSPDPLLMIR